MEHDNNFPILFENSEIKVFKNSSNEIFVQLKRGDKPTLRIGDYGNSLKITATGCNFSPNSFGGLGGFLVSSKVKKYEVLDFTDFNKDLL